ncbi:MULTISPECIES: hypothetical protein [Acidianus]|uniref:ATPase n=1 Tax=Candidatus Acidianus copahuensis TaxID=1160895 RepID=A0A031LNJ8_9CREN|nr:MULTISPECIES: hypothetical protein [Acidianus]EZQ03124.1 hypothetical protein CM19_09850 [Candidatus Acidianus copahuensis]NON63123.1 hypothetical protein [Acidianus sp. RZ1]
MTNSNLEDYAKVIVEFEQEVKKIKLSTAEDSKRLIELAQQISLQMETEAKKVFDEIVSNIEEEKQDIINDMRKRASEERELKINKMRKSAEKNLERAVEEVLNEIKGAFK